jgi:hypothetical protein
MYVKKKRTPLMFDGPTPVNMPPAMAGIYWGGRNRAVGADDIITHEGTHASENHEIEIDPEFVGTPSLPKILDPSAWAAFFTPKTPAPKPVVNAAGKVVGIAPPSIKDKLVAAGPLLFLVGAGAYFALRKRS